jgi:hypothetical protein
MTDRVGPIGYIIFTAFASFAVWGYAMLQHMPVR